MDKLDLNTVDNILNDYLAQSSGLELLLLKQETDRLWIATFNNLEKAYIRLCFKKGTDCYTKPVQIVPSLEHFMKDNNSVIFQG